MKIDSNLHIAAIAFAKSKMVAALTKRDTDPDLFLQKVTCTRGLFDNGGFFLRIIFDYAWLNGQNKNDTDAWVDIQTTDNGFIVLPPPSLTDQTK